MFTWDYRNRLAGVNDSTGGATTYAYDGMNRRISKSVGGTMTRFVYDRDNVLLEFTGSAVPSVRYLHGTMVDQVLAQEKGGQTSWMLADQLGSVRDLVSNDLVSNAGTVVGHFTYDLFGQVVSATGAVDSRYKYTGRELDGETGLYYYRARYYDSRVGKFIGQDPIQFRAGDSNLYRYVGNSPLNEIDPSGQQSLVSFRVPSIPRVKPPIPIIAPAPTPQPQPNPQPAPRPSPNGCSPNPNSCPPCESNLKGGAYKQVRDANKNKGAAVHHMPSWAATRDSALALGHRQDGFDLAPAICMTAEDHRNTISFAGRNRLYKPTQIGYIDSGRYDEAQDIDVVDIRLKFGNKYNVAITQMYNYTLHIQQYRPELFKLEV
jgi:RHS repeat-associated protein